VCVALGMERAMGMPHIVICRLSASTVFIAHYLMNCRIFQKKKLYNTKCVLIFSTTLSEAFLIAGRI